MDFNDLINEEQENNNNINNNQDINNNEEKIDNNNEDIDLNEKEKILIENIKKNTNYINRYKNDLIYNETERKFNNFRDYLDSKYKNILSSFIDFKSKGGFYNANLIDFINKCNVDNLFIYIF